jgi:competence protein ComEC
VTFLDIGQGDAAIVELPDGAVWLVDAGGHAHARDLGVASAPGAAIMRVLAAYGHARIDVAVISHPHPDHYLGLAGLALPIGELWLAAAPDEAVAAPGPLPSFDDLVDVLAARGTRVVHPSLGLARSQAGVELVVWAPRYQPEDGAAVTCAADPVRTVNDNSLVVSLHYRGRTLVFAGDLEAEGEELVVAAGLPRADVVKVPHHGSPTSSSPAFVAATRPALAVISCARGNSFGFPAPAVVERWRAAGADVARTDTDGAVTVIVDAAGRLTVDRFVVQSPGGESGARSRSVR